MTVARVEATRVTCDRVTDGQPCPARVLGDNPRLDEAAVRLAAAERGWAIGPEGDLCPSHR